MGKPALLRQMWRRLLHIAPEAARPHVGVAWALVWEPGERLLEHLERLPAGLLALWLHTDRGHILIGAGPSRYVAGPCTWRERSYTGMCLLDSADIAGGTAADAGAAPMWAVLLAWCDHLLGSLGEPDGVRFSAGVGATPRLQQAAARLQQAIALGYAADLLGNSDAQGYLIGVWQLYLTAPTRLNATDPLSYRLLHDSLMDEAWWELVWREVVQRT